ncbi:MAG: phosphoribosylformylglycinamidine synthase [Pleomorphochaeta sp.]
MVKTVYVKKKNNFKDTILLNEINQLLSLNIQDLVTYNRYEVDGLSDDIFEKSVKYVFSEVQLDEVYFELPKSKIMFAIEYLDGQFDQRADSAKKCISLLVENVKPKVKNATVYCIEGDLNKKDINKIKNYLINPVESKEANLEEREEIEAISKEEIEVKILDDFITLDKLKLEKLLKDYNLAMDIDDLILFQSYFISENRNPSIVELKVVDTYWSDHCRHTTFNTIFNNVEIESDEINEVYLDYKKNKQLLNSNKNDCLMDIATIASKILKKSGYNKDVEVSEEINACSINIKVDVDEKEEDYLLLFKNETHNHPTEIEPFGGAATCIGGAIRDPLSSRAYVYQAMRLSGSADPREAFKNTLPNKLPQRTIARVSAKGNSSYGNQIGLATPLVKEFYHDGYKAKHMELGAVIASAKKENVVREVPQKGDIVILLGGRTGRDGIGGATGSSKAHDKKSLDTCGAEVQKGNATEERKLQRFFRNGDITKKIKRCNDFGAGGVCVAIGELSAGLKIELDKVPLKYENLNIEEIAISESQERMAIVVRKEDSDYIINEAIKENIEATIVAIITDDNRLTMTYENNTVVSISREFLDTNGSEKYTDVKINKQSLNYSQKMETTLDEYLKVMFSDINYCSGKGLSNIFDSTIGATNVLMPYGGIYQKSKEQVICSKIPVDGDTKTVSLMSYGFDPYLVDQSPFYGSYLSILSSVSKLIASGANINSIYLSLQEYFPSVKNNKERWGNVTSALLGAYKAQMDLKVAAIGGKDSMSGTFENIDVPKTLVSFAVGTTKIENVKPSLFTKSKSKIILLPITDNKREYFKKIEKVISLNNILSSYSLTKGGLVSAIVNMSFGNRIGLNINDNIDLFDFEIGSILIEVDDCKGINDILEELSLDYKLVGTTIKDYQINYRFEKIDLINIEQISDNTLEKVYPTKVADKIIDIPNVDSFKKKNIVISNSKFSKPRVLLPVFVGTNCEYDSRKAFEEVGAEVSEVIINTYNQETLNNSINEFSKKLNNSQILFFPGGFSFADEPEGSAKFISSFIQSPKVKESINTMYKNRDGLILGICNGFQALVKSGLLPYSNISDINSDSPTLTYNKINQHQSSLVKVRISSINSPWLMHYEVGQTLLVPISHGEGRFVCNDYHAKKLIEKGQIVSQYVDNDNKPTMDINYNPNGSCLAIESIVSEDGRILGRMGHLERSKIGLYKNVKDYKSDNLMFKGAISYYK